MLRDLYERLNHGATYLLGNEPRGRYISPGVDKPISEIPLDLINIQLGREVINGSLIIIQIGAFDDHTRISMLGKKRDLEERLSELNLPEIPKTLADNTFKCLLAQTKSGSGNETIYVEERLEPGNEYKLAAYINQLIPQQIAKARVHLRLAKEK